MSGVWRCLHGLISTPLIPLPHEVGIARERLGSSEGHGVVVSPQSSSSAKRLESAVGRKPGSCDDENAGAQNALPLVMFGFMDHSCYPPNATVEKTKGRKPYKGLSHFGKCDALFELDNRVMQSLLCTRGVFRQH